MNIATRLLLFIATYILVAFAMGVLLGAIGAPEFGVGIVIALAVATLTGRKRRAQP